MAATGGFQLLKRRRVVERTLAWLNRNRRLAKDFEASVEKQRRFAPHRQYQIAGGKVVQTLRMTRGNIGAYALRNYLVI